MESLPPSTARLLDGAVLTTEGHPLPPYPLSSSSEEEEEEEEEELDPAFSSSSSSSSPPVLQACARLCSLLLPSSLAISRSLSAAMPLLSPTERDVALLRRRRCVACRAVERAMLPVREHWAEEMRGAERAAAAAMERAERAAAAEMMRRKKE